MELIQCAFEPSAAEFLNTLKEKKILIPGIGAVSLKVLFNV